MSIGAVRRYREKNRDILNAKRREYYHQHREQSAIRRREYNITNRDQQLIHAREYKISIRKAVIAKYGGVCTCPCGCDETLFGFLTIDHPNNDGKLDREKNGSTQAMYRHLLKQPVSDRHRVMCYNCNCGRAANGGVCPRSVVVK